MAKKELETDSQSDFVNMNNSDINRQAAQMRVGSSANNASSKILEQLKQNEKISKDILKSVNFIKHYYLWQSIFNFLKVFIIVAVIVLGIVSWRSILDYITNNLPNNFSEQLIRRSLE